MIFNMQKYLKEHNIEIASQSGNELLCRCPWKENHNNKDINPSFSINIKKNLYYCHGCGNKGHITFLISYLNGISIKEAYKIFYGVRTLISPDLVKRKINKIIIGEQKNEKKFKKKYILRIPKLKNYSKSGIRYLKKRGITEDLIKKFGIKFCIEGYYKNRVIIPVFDINNDLSFFEARLFKRTNSGERKVLYPFGVNKNETLFNANNIKSKKEVIIVEGIMDCIYINKFKHNVVASFGTHISNKQVGLLSKFKKIIICFDGDSAGYNAANKMAEELKSRLDIRIMRLGKNKDPDQYTKYEFEYLYKKAYKLDDIQSIARMDLIKNKLKTIV